MQTYYLKDDYRKILKQTFGVPILGKQEEVIKKYEAYLAKNTFEKIVTVGDYTSLSLFSNVKIFDKKTKRKSIQNNLKYAFSFTNLPGTINKDCWNIIIEALTKNENIFVKGEEDLLLIPTILLAKDNTLIVYGLPNEGISLIKVSSEVKQTFQNLLNNGFSTKQKEG